MTRLAALPRTTPKISVAVVSRAYQLGWSLEEIAAAFHVSRKAIRRRLDFAGILPRPHHRGCRRMVKGALAKEWVR